MRILSLSEPSFGDWIVETRLRKRMDAKECAARAGVTPQAWSEWEVGRSRRKDGKPPQPTRETVRKVAVGLCEPEQSVLRAAGYLPAAPLVVPRQPIPDEAAQLPPELEQVYALHGRVLRELPPGPARDMYLAKLRATAEADLAMIEAGLLRQ